MQKSHFPVGNQSTLSHRNQLGYLRMLNMALNVPARATIQPVSSARKPVIVRRLSRDWTAGYASTAPADQPDALELLDNAGRLQLIPWESIKWVCYVRELLPGPHSGSHSSSEATSPERLLRRRFISRPRTAGLWLRLTLADGDELEAIAPNDSSLVEGSGLLLTPPDTRSNTQRIFVPRTSIRSLAVVAVIGSAVRQRGPQPDLQPDLFPND